MGIPIGKLALYTAAAGIHPATTLPVSLDVGTDNAALLDDDLYIGYRAPRLRGAEYDSLVDEFVGAVKEVFPKALLQWEDFKKGTAFTLLDRYRKVLPSFNDDIQGTAAVAVAAVVAGSRVSGVPMRAQRVAILGAGAAGVGIGRLLRESLRRAGVAGHDLTGAVASLDSQGLVVDDTEIRDVYKKELAWPRELAETLGLGKGRPRDLGAVIRALKPTVLIGTSGEPDTFTADVIREMAKHVDRPLVLPLSNPTSQAEAKPEHIVQWTNGRALVATGSPFPPVRYGERSFVVGQANNAFVFPGIGLGALVAETPVVTDEMFEAAAERLAGAVRAEDLASGSLFPPVPSLRTVTAAVAEAVVAAARDAGLGRAVPAGAVAVAMWEPDYPELVAV
jgi:malic enzyme